MENKLLNTSLNTEVNVMDSRFVETMLNKILRNQLLTEIDRSLQDRNKEEFLRLTDELKNIS